MAVAVFLGVSPGDREIARFSAIPESTSTLQTMLAQLTVVAES
jgi:hypothetical protein